MKTLIQDYPEFAKKRMDYQFDQLSGKVNLVAYQAGQVDAFYHRYSYDADLRLQAVQTSRDFVIWDNDATYKYYRHGPLRRMEMGQDKIQGVDYYYSIQGWIKGMNHGAGGADSIGREGVANTVYANFAQDAFAYNLSYHTDDYKPISSNFAFDATEINHKIDNISASLFNGNIRAMWGGLDKFAIATNAVIPPSAQGQVFQYDQLNRLLQAKDFTYFPNNQSAITSFAHYMKLTYDPNGNIKTLNRFGVVKTGNAGVTTAMDNLTYTYQSGSNKLTHVDDAIDAKNFDNDIDDQTPNNYTYDAIGNLISDNAEDIQKITWNVYGKMTSVVNIKKERSLNFYYDAGGNRVKKIDGKEKATYYVRDAQGNVMAVYAQEKNKDITAESFYIYGSSRVGELDTSINMRTATVSTFSFNRIRGIKRYEMSNHLGNVMVVVSDRKVYDGSVFKADLVSTTDFYAFGMVMSDRSWNTEGYRYGMNGQEKVDEITSGHYTAEYWEYDARIGRRWNIDPVLSVGQSPYATFDNNPITYADKDGKESGDPGKLTIPMSPNEVDTKIWKPVPEGTGAERLHSQRWTNSDGTMLAFDKGTSGAKGWEGIDHWHVYNSEGKRLDATGNFATTKNANGKYVKGSNSAHFKFGETTQISLPREISPELITQEVPTFNSYKAPAFEWVPTVGKYVRTGTKVVGVVGIASSIYNITTAKDKSRATVGEVSGWLGAVAFGKLGAGLGAMGGPFAEITVPVGGLIGSIYGYFQTKAIGEKAYDNANKK